MNESLKFYMDSIIVETMIGNSITKNAEESMTSSLLNTVYTYFHDKIKDVENSDNKFEMISNFFLPGILTGLGFPKIAGLLKLSSMFFGFNLAHIVSEIFSSLKSEVFGGKKIDSNTVNSIVSSSVNSNLPPDPSDDADVQKRIEEFKSSASCSLRDAQFIKIALDSYSSEYEIDFNKKLTIKQAKGVLESILGKFLGQKSATSKILTTLLSFFIKAALAAGGFMVAGDLITKMTGIPSKENQKPEASVNEPSALIDTSTKQSIFKVNPSYSEEYNNAQSRWILPVDINSLPNILISWATEIYPDLKGNENIIESTKTFNDVLNVIKQYNRGSPPNMVFIPRQWKSRKQIVDYFVDEVAANNPDLGQSNPSFKQPTKTTPSLDV